MQLLLRFANILILTLFASDAVDDVTAFACQFVFDGKYGVCLCNGDCGAKCPQFACVATFVATSGESNWCIDLLFCVHLGEVDCFASATRETESTFFTHLVLLIDGCCVVCFWWIDGRILWQAPTHEQIIEASVASIRDNRWLRKKQTTFFT